jgi:hypothetical protein
MARHRMDGELGAMQLSYDHGVRFYQPNQDRVGSLPARQVHQTGWLNCRQARMIGEQGFPFAYTVMQVVDTVFSRCR